MNKHLVFTFSLLLITACIKTEHNFAEAIGEAESAFITKECQLNDNFLAEPEFFELRDAEFCSADLTVTRREHISATEAVVDYKITFMANHENLNKWLIAYRQFQVRVSPSAEQAQVKAFIEKLINEKRDWVYQKHTVKLTLIAETWVIDDVIH